MANNCALCNASAKEDDRVFCDLCKALYHGTCAGLSRQETACLKSANRRLQFFCKNCNFVQIMKGLKNEVDNLMSKVAVLEEKLENQQTANSNGPIITQGQELIAQEQLFEEFEDRRRRAKNVIISNVPESGRDTIDDRKTDDLNTVVDLIASCGLGNLEIKKCYRVGKGSPNKIRPICVVLPSEDIKVSLLSKYKTRNSIYINNDLTKMQQDKAYRIRQEFKRRLGDGEEGIKLKYYNGIPTIVRSKNQ